MPHEEESAIKESKWKPNALFPKAQFHLDPIRVIYFGGGYCLQKCFTHTFASDIEASRMYACDLLPVHEDIPCALKRVEAVDPFPDDSGKRLHIVRQLDTFKYGPRFDNSVKLVAFNQKGVVDTGKIWQVC